MSLLAAVLRQLMAATLPALEVLAILAAVFTILGAVGRACNAGPPWWRKPDLSTDLCYALLPRLFYSYAQASLLILGIVLCYGITDAAGIAGFLADGHGPLSGRPFWQLVVLYLLGNDLVMYATHRAFHSARLWRFHAVHHSSEQVEWVSATRFHPVDHVLHNGLSDIVMLLLGIPPEVVVWLTPFNAGMSALVHANLAWDFGPFRHLLVSPVYHRWHHAGTEGRNFAATFPVYDLLFGTFHLPRGGVPAGFGPGDAAYPRGFLRQLVRPFRPGIG